MLFGFGFIGSVLLLGVSKVFKKYLIQFCVSKFSSSKLTDRKITIFLLIMSILFLFLTLTAVLVNKNPDAILLKTGEQTKPEPGRVILNQENKPILNEGKQKAAYAVTISVNPVWEKQEKIALRTVRPEINYLKIFFV